MHQIRKVKHSPVKRMRRGWITRRGRCSRTKAPPANYNLNMKKRPVSRFSKTKVTKSGARSWHNGADAEIYLYARSLQKAAKSLVQTLEPEPNSETLWDVCPIIWLCRQALELHLKSLAGEGSNFLKSQIDSISLYRTHSLRWLAQIVCQVIKAVGWESDFTCEGVSSLTEFSSLINDIESLDPVSCAVHSRVPGHASAAQIFQKISGARFARKLDALIELLDVTADALAATWDQRVEASGNDFGPVIQ